MTIRSQSCYGPVAEDEQSQKPSATQPKRHRGLGFVLLKLDANATMLRMRVWTDASPVAGDKPEDKYGRTGRFQPAAQFVGAGHAILS